MRIAPFTCRPEAALLFYVIPLFVAVPVQALIEVPEHRDAGAWATRRRL